MLERVFARCADDAECNRRFPALADQFARLDARLRHGTVTTWFTDPVDGSVSSKQGVRIGLKDGRTVATRGFPRVS